MTSVKDTTMSSSDNSEDQHEVEVEALDGSFLDISNVETVDESKPQITFKCEICNIKYAYESTLKRHMMKHSNDPKFNCSICHQYFATEVTLQEHCSKFHTHRYVCETCGKDFKTKLILNHHLLQVHKQEHEKLQSYKCPFEGCNKIFSRKQFYQYHLNTHAGVKPYSCKHCSRNFSSLYRQKEHERICIGEVKIICNTCQSTFTDRASLKRHDDAVHKGIKHVCACGKQYTQLSSLRRHQLVKKH